MPGNTKFDFFFNSTRLKLSIVLLLTFGMKMQLVGIHSVTRFILLQITTGFGKEIKVLFTENYTVSPDHCEKRCK